MTGCTVHNNTSNPFLGVWTSNFDGCVENYEFKDDGVRTYISNEEKGTVRYEFTKLSVSTYKMTDVITATNGRADCAGETGAMVGHEARFT